MNHYFILISLISLCNKNTAIHIGPVLVTIQKNNLVKVEKETEIGLLTCHKII